jgi:tartrate-resistant acid phosphatase type 5
MRDGIVYFVDGLGGAPRYGFSAPVAGSAVRYSADWGALRVTATGSALVFEFRTASGQLVDRYRLSAQ